MKPKEEECQVPGLNQLLPLVSWNYNLAWHELLAKSDAVFSMHFCVQKKGLDGSQNCVHSYKVIGGPIHQSDNHLTIANSPYHNFEMNDSPVLLCQNFVLCGMYSSTMMIKR